MSGRVIPREQCFAEARAVLDRAAARIAADYAAGRLTAEQAAIVRELIIPAPAARTAA